MILVNLKKDKADFEDIRTWYRTFPRGDAMRPIRIGQNVVNPVTFEKFDNIKFHNAKAFVLFFHRYKNDDIIESVESGLF